MLRLPGQEADVRRTDKTKMSAPRQTRQTLRMEELRDQEARAAAAPKAKTLTTNSKMDGGAHASSGASRELLQSIAARLDAKLQKHAKGSWAKLFFAVDHDGSERVEFHEFKALLRNKTTDTIMPGLELGKKVVSDPELRMLWTSADADRSGFVTAPEFKLFIQNAEEPPAAEETEEEWLSQEALWSIAHRLEKKLQRYAKGSWMKLFFVIDKDGSGRICEREFEALVRNKAYGTAHPGLEIPKEEISDEELHLLWKSADEDGSGKVTAAEFKDFFNKLMDHHANAVRPATPPERRRAAVVEVAPDPRVAAGRARALRYALGLERDADALLEAKSALEAKVEALELRLEGERAAFAAKQLADEAAKQAAIAAKDGELDAAEATRASEVGRLETKNAALAEAAAAAAADAADAKADRDRLLGKFDALEAELDDARVRSDAGLRRAASCVRAVQDAVGGAMGLKTEPALRVRFELDAARWSLSSPTNRFEQRSRERPLARDAASATAAAALNIVRHYGEKPRKPADRRDDKPSFFSGAHGAVLLKPGFGLPKLDAARAPTLVERAAAAQREPPRPAPPAAEPPGGGSGRRRSSGSSRRPPSPPPRSS
ncbi:hypothetical protein JL722_6062 [Aureococcus anophagefferens]|nr:hypothetical protein JL722_6062 [Aureococcus anophagefferens]